MGSGCHGPCSWLKTGGPPRGGSSLQCLGGAPAGGQRCSPADGSGRCGAASQWRCGCAGRRTLSEAVGRGGGGRDGAGKARCRRGGGRAAGGSRRPRGFQQSAVDGNRDAFPRGATREAWGGRARRRASRVPHTLCAPPTNRDAWLLFSSPIPRSGWCLADVVGKEGDEPACFHRRHPGRHGRQQTPCGRNEVDSLAMPIGERRRPRQLAQPRLMRATFLTRQVHTVVLYTSPGWQSSP